MKEKLVGKQRRRPGLSIYEFNMETNEVQRRTETKKIIVREKCLYRQTLNAKSCIAKLTREGVISKKDSIIYITR